ncbi:MAG: glycosyltransferase [Nitrospinae bacterium]|nr:glycosyltransferase [Nitrospinota bacterium]
MRGGEKCLEVFCRLYPEADLFTLLHIPGSVSSIIETRKIHTSFLQLLPFIEKKYRHFLPLMPLAIEKFDLTGYDLVLSSSHCVAKGVIPGEKTFHISYCYTPMRYIWDQYEQYFNRTASGILTSTAMGLLAPGLRRWDVRSSKRVDEFVAISRHVQKRIKKYYHRESTVIYPPVDSAFYSPTGERGEDFFLIVSAFAPYKRLDLAVEAFNELGYPLVIIGEGQSSEYLRSIAGPNIQFRGWLSNEEIRSCYARCRAFVFCGEEDFGITPLEAQCMGKPVIGFAKGGLLETVIPDRQTWKAETGIGEEKTCHPTGVFFHQQTPEALISAIRHFEKVEDRFESEVIRNHALPFDLNIFSDRIREFIEDRYRLRKHQC